MAVHPPVVPLSSDDVKFDPGEKANSSYYIKNFTFLLINL
jgi:hypothetical protein